ncbi:MAG TPA: hypothetical protein VL147_01650 [Devosia sp.]|nr:hypothetical protein [Devosia sp.]
MPRKRQPARLYLNPKERVWVIRDGSHTQRTGFAEGQRREAEEALAAYVQDRFKPAEREGSLAALSVAEVLDAYLREHAPNQKDPARIGWAVSALTPFWGEKMLTEIRGVTCRAYADQRRSSVRANMKNAKTEARRTRRVSDGTIRRELGVLRAAIGYWHAEHGPLDSVPVVSLPPKPEAKPHSLERSEVARLLAGSLGWYQLSWSDIATRKVTTKWKRDHGNINRHTARFIVIGRYTATRPGAILSLQHMPNTSGGWPDLEREILYRRGEGEGDSKKRRPVTALGRSAVAHFRRWAKVDAAARDQAATELDRPVTSHMHVVSWKGGSISDIGKSFATALDFAGLPAVYTPHILRHTRVTWWVEAGLSLEEVADAAGMTVEMVENVYWHRSPGFQRKAAEA